MNTALKNDSVASTQPKRTGEYQTTNLFRISNVKVDVESNLRGLHQLLNKSDFVPEPKEDIKKVKSSNRNSMFVEGEESRKKRSVGNVNSIEFSRLEYPLVEHQDYSIFSEHQRGGFHTRNNMKDEYSAKCNIGIR
jgi:hypothetical protein